MSRIAINTQNMETLLCLHLQLLNILGFDVDSPIDMQEVSTKSYKCLYAIQQGSVHKTGMGNLTSLHVRMVEEYKPQPTQTGIKVEDDKPEDEVVIDTPSMKYIFASQKHFDKALSIGGNLAQYAKVVFRKDTKEFVKHRAVGHTIANTILKQAKY